MPKVFIRQVRSRGLYPNWNLVVKEVGQTLDTEVKQLFLNYFYRIVESWSEEKRPAFKARKKITAKEISIYVFPAGPNKWIWELVSRTGAEPHTIAAKNAEYLVFMWGGPGSYQAKTDTSGGYDGPGEVVGGTIRKTEAVEHPGFIARDFENFISEELTPKARRLVENAFRRGVRKAKASPKPPISK